MRLLRNSTPYTCTRRKWLISVRHIITYKRITPLSTPYNCRMNFLSHKTTFILGLHPKILPVLGEAGLKDLLNVIGQIGHAADMLFPRVSRWIQTTLTYSFSDYSCVILRFVVRSGVWRVFLHRLSRGASSCSAHARIGAMLQPQLHFPNNPLTHHNTPIRGITSYDSCRRKHAWPALATVCARLSGVTLIWMWIHIL